MGGDDVDDVDEVDDVGNLDDGDALMMLPMLTTMVTLTTLMTFIMLMMLLKTLLPENRRYLFLLPLIAQNLKIGIQYNTILSLQLIIHHMDSKI